MNGPTETPQQAARRLAASAIRDGYKPESLLVYKLRDSELVFQRAFDKRWASSTGKREREQGVQGEQRAQG
ncbi:MAG: hypothetical protein ACREYC_20340, partial [Gammaproteobacteria bacterium]